MFSTYLMFGLWRCDRYYALPYVSDSFFYPLISFRTCICSLRFIQACHLSVRIEPYALTSRVVRACPIRIMAWYVTSLSLLSSLHRTISATSSTMYLTTHAFVTYMFCLEFLLRSRCHLGYQFDTTSSGRSTACGSRAPCVFASVLLLAAIGS